MGERTSRPYHDTYLVRRRDKSDSFCPGTYPSGRGCGRYPGEGTPHEGYGLCHRCSKRADEEVWKMAFELAGQINITPWEALLGCIKISTAQVVWLEQQIQLAIEDEDDDRIRLWQRESRAERKLLGQTSKAAIDSGIAERLVEDAQADTQRLVRDTVSAIATAIKSLGLSQSEYRRALIAAQKYFANTESLMVNGRPIDPGKRYLLKGQEIVGTDLILRRMPKIIIPETEEEKRDREVHENRERWSKLGHWKWNAHGPVCCANPEKPCREE